MAAHRRNDLRSCLLILPIGFISAELQSYCKKMSFDNKSVMDHKHAQLGKMNEKLSAHFKTELVSIFSFTNNYKNVILFSLFLVSKKQSDIFLTYQ
jgi:hypothetical protein